MIRRFLYKLFGWRAYISIEAWRQRREFSQYAYRDAESAHLSLFVNKGDVCLDVGANLGTYAFYLANIVGETGQVFAFEPHPDTYAGLAANMTKAGLTNVQPYNVGMSDQEGTAELFVPQRVGLPSHGRAHLHSPQAQEAGERIEVQLTTVDAFCTQHKLARVDFIKMDIEGAELLALRGAVETIGAYRPKLLLEIEAAHAQKYGYEPQDIFAMLAAYGYRDVYCACDGALARLDVATFTVAERPFPTLVEAALGCLVNNFFVTS